MLQRSFKKAQLLFLALILSSATFYTHADTPKSTLVLVGTADTKKSFHGRWLALIYSEVAKRLDMHLDYQGYPAKRASKLSDKGVAHGEIHRVESYGDAHPNMIRVDESHFSIYFSAFSHDKTRRVFSWKELSNKNYSVGFRAGIKRSATKLSTLNLKSLTPVSDNITGLKMLHKERFDFFIDVESSVVNILNINPSLNNIHNAGVIEELQTYAYIHKDYRHLIPKIERALKEMKDEGLIDTFKSLSLK